MASVSPLLCGHTRHSGLRELVVTRRGDGRGGDGGVWRTMEAVSVSGITSHSTGTARRWFESLPPAAARVATLTRTAHGWRRSMLGPAGVRVRRGSMLPWRALGAMAMLRVEKPAARSSFSV
jgi:hypothetical protein